MLPLSWINCEEDDGVSWPPGSIKESEASRDEELNASLSSFKSMLETGDCLSFINTPNPPPPLYHPDFSSLEFNPLDSSSSYSTSQMPSFLPPKSVVPCTLFNNSSFDNGFDLLGCEPQFFSTQYYSSPIAPMLTGLNGLSQQFQLPDADEAAIGGVSEGDFVGLFPSRSEILRPLAGTHSSTLFQKRAAVRQSVRIPSSKNDEDLTNLDDNTGDMELGNKRKRNCVVEMNYDSSDDYEATEKSGEGNSNTNGSSVTVRGQKGKKKGMPAKNLMAERRRRKKLNDRLYMLRSVIPKISKMDRASILGDAIDYLKMLMQRINDLHGELEEATPQQQGSFVPLTTTTTTSFYPTPPNLPYRVKEELGSTSSIPNPKNQPARVEVRLAGEGRAMNIHMFCARRPGLLLSTMGALEESLGLDIQQAVISCFNGFALDVFHAEQCRQGQDISPEQIKAVLLDCAGFHGVV